MWNAGWVMSAVQHPRSGICVRSWMWSVTSPIHSKFNCVNNLHEKLNWMFSGTSQVCHQVCQFFVSSVRLLEMIPSWCRQINWGNCAVLTGNSVGLRIVLSSRLSHREPCSSLTALFLSIIVTRTRRCTGLTKKLTSLIWNLCCAREHSIRFFVQFFLNS